MQFGGGYRTIQGSPSPQHHPTPSPPAPSTWQVATLLPVMPPSVPIQQPSEHTTYLNMDTQNLSQINSSELISLIAGAYPPQQDSNNINRINIDQENMTDSLTRCALQDLESYRT